MRAAVYLRQSQDRGGDELGIDRQRADCAALLASRGWQSAREFVDNDTSATSRKPREQFRAMLDAVRAGQVDVIVARDVDRLARRLTDLEAVLEECHNAGARVVTAREGVDTDTDGGRLVARILGSVAQGEAERKSRRQADAQAQAAAAGRRVGGRRAFGYAQDGRTVVDEEADAVRDGFDALLAGAPLGGIARDWTARGFQRPQAGGPWTQPAVRAVLGNPRYAALRRYIPAAERRARAGRLAPDDGIVGPADWPALVPEETYRAAVAVLRDPARRAGTPGARQLLTGVALCGECGELVHGGGASHGQPVYRCRSLRHINRLAAPVDRYVSAVAVARLSRPDARELLTADPADRPDVAALRGEAQALRARLDGVAAEFADGELTAGQLRTITARLRTRLADAERAMADAGRVDVLGPLVDADDVSVVWAGLPIDRRRVVIDTLMTVRLHLVGRGTRTFRPETVQLDPRR